MKALVNDLVSMSCFLADDLIINCSSIGNNQLKIVDSLIENFTQKIENQKLSNSSGMNKNKAHFITGVPN